MRKTILAILVLVSLVILVIFVFLGSKGDNQLSVAEIRQRFNCDRITTDVRATDIYCENPNYYYEDSKKGSVIDPSDFEDPRYKDLKR